MASTRSRRRREHQRGLPPRALPRVGVGAVVEEGRHRGRTARCGGEVQGGRARGAGGRRYVGARFDQRFDDLGVPAGARHVQRRVVPDAGHRVGGAAGLKEGLDHLGVAPLGRPVQGRHAVPVGGVDIGAGLEERADRRQVAHARCVGDGRVPRRRAPGQTAGEDRGEQRPRDPSSDAAGRSWKLHRPTLPPRWSPAPSARTARTSPCCRRSGPSRGPATASASASRSPWGSRRPPSGAGCP